MGFKSTTERKIIMTNINANDQLTSTIRMMHNAQGYPMLVLKNLDAPMERGSILVHRLAVQISKSEFVVYTFTANLSKESHFLGMETVKAPFYQLLNEYAELVLKSPGYTTLEVLPC